MQYTFKTISIKAIFPTCLMRLGAEGCLLTNAIPTATKDSEATGKHLPPEVVSSFRVWDGACFTCFFGSKSEVITY